MPKYDADEQYNWKTYSEIEAEKKTEFKFGMALGMISGFGVGVAICYGIGASLGY